MQVCTRMALLSHTSRITASLVEGSNGAPALAAASHACTAQCVLSQHVVTQEGTLALSAGVRARACVRIPSTSTLYTGGHALGVCCACSSGNGRGIAMHEILATREWMQHLHAGVRARARTRHV
ncbi:hypothetical protein EON67_04940 [archaeon]|nr:MAG: hypothetical protein EON67_04940 [archaeon]